MDLQKVCHINAVQLNYAENDTKLFGRSPNIYYQYLLEYSTDNKNWKVLADKRQTKTDAPHDYIELSVPVSARYLRLTNYHIPGGTFSIADLRVFGKGNGQLPGIVKDLKLSRSESDRCVVKLNWSKMPGVTGFNVRYGTAKDKLYQTYQVLGTDNVTINSLNAAEKYYFEIDAFNENGIAKGTNRIELN
jgi:xylan 1,4-beta-xylosidase